MVFCVPPAAAQSVTSLITDLPADARNLWSKPTAIIAGTTGVVSAVFGSNDHRISNRARTLDNWDTYLGAGDELGVAGLQGGIALGTYVLGRLAKSPRTTQVGADLVRGQILGGGIGLALKLAIDRERPNGRRGHSFPSGHAQMAFTTATVIHRHFGWKAGVPAYVLAAYIGASRLPRNEHYASDVLVGAGLGVAAGHAVTVGRGRARVTIAPSLSPGGASVTAIITP